MRQYGRAARRSWTVVTGVTLLGIALAAGATLAQAPTYFTTTKLFVPASSAASVSDLSAGTNHSQQIANSFAEVVTTKLILQPVIDDLKLDLSLPLLASNVSASASLNTVLADVKVTDTDPQSAARTANFIAAVMIDTVPELAPASTGTDQAPVKLTVAQPAGIATSPSSPRVPVYLAVGLLLGVAIAIAIAIAFGVGIAVLRELLDNRIRRNTTCAR